MKQSTQFGHANTQQIITLVTKRFETFSALCQRLG